MTAYAYYDDAEAGANLPAEARRHNVLLKKRMKTADILASNSVLTAAGTITAADVIQAIQVPSELVIELGVVEIITPEGATCTIDVGLDGGDEMFDGIELNVAAGTKIATLIGDDWGAATLMCYPMTTDDTLDVTYEADTDTVDFWLYVKGFMLW